MAALGAIAQASSAQATAQRNTVDAGSRHAAAASADPRHGSLRDGRSRAAHEVRRLPPHTVSCSHALPCGTRSVGAADALSLEARAPLPPRLSGGCRGGHPAVWPLGPRRRRSWGLLRDVRRRQRCCCCHGTAGAAATTVASTAGVPATPRGPVIATGDRHAHRSRRASGPLLSLRTVGSYTLHVDLRSELN